MTLKPVLELLYQTGCVFLAVQSTVLKCKHLLVGAALPVSRRRPAQRKPSAEGWPLLSDGRVPGGAQVRRRRHDGAERLPCEPCRAARGRAG